MSDVNYAFQANFKFGPQYKETLINVPANTPEEMLGKLKWLEENAAAFVATHTALHGVEAVAPLAANVVSTQVQQEPAYQPAPEPQQSGWGQPQQSAPPQFAQPQQAASTGPMCQHGPMEWKDFTSKAGNHVRGHFCNARPSCPPQYANNKK